MIKTSLGKFALLAYVIFFRHDVYAQVFDKKRNDELFSIHAECIENAAPKGSVKQLNEWRYDVVKEKCLCFATAIIEKYYPITQRSSKPLDEDVRKIAIVCENKVNLRREVELYNELRQKKQP